MQASSTKVQRATAHPHLLPQLAATSQARLSYWLPAHVRACHTCAGLVFLDLLTNRYTGLPPRETAALSSFVRNLVTRDQRSPCADAAQSRAEMERIANTLVGRGLLSRDPPQYSLVTRECELAPATQAIVVAKHAMRPAWSFRIASAFTSACIRVKWSLHTASLLEIANDVVARRRANEAMGEPVYDLESLINEFQRHRRLVFTARDRCLFNALTLVHFLSSFGYSPSWVIGVRTRPWGAHSWVQLGDMVLDGSAEHVLEYVPILVI